MRFLKNIVDKLEPTFSEGGKLAKLHSVYDGFKTFLFVPNTTSKSGVHIHDVTDSKRTMITVVLALVPAMLFGMWNVGYQHFLAIGQEAGFWMQFWFGFLAVLPTLIVSYVVGLGIEFTVAQIKGHEIQEGFLVTGFIIPLIVPVDTPLWMVAIATAFAVIFAKEVFGGTGYNVFNVALITRAFLFFAYPTAMSGDQVWVRTRDAFWAAILLITGVASWKIMLSVFAGGAITALIFNLWGPDTAAAQMPWYMHLVLGGFAFGAVFMATDPVTSPRTECAKWIYGLLIGAMAIIIRVLNPGFPEGMMLAILLMNIFGCLFDYMVVQSNIKKRLKRVPQK